MNQNNSPRNKILNTIGDLLTDICESSPQDKDTNEGNSTYHNDHLNSLLQDISE